MEKKITLKNLYNIVYNGEEPFESEKSLADFFYVNTIAALVEKQINDPKSVSINDIICYFLTEMGLDMQDYYLQLQKGLKDDDADVTLFEHFGDDELFYDMYVYSDYVLKKLGIDIDKATESSIKFNSNYVSFFVGEDILKDLANNIKINNENRKNQYLKFIDIIYNSERNEWQRKKIVNLLSDAKIGKEVIIANRNKMLSEIDNALVVKLSESILNPNSKKENKSVLDVKTINEKLIDLEKRVVGQEDALSKVKYSILASTAGFKDESKPIASFLLTGPTGVGKTETAKAVADSIFDGKIYVVDMSTYKNEIDVSRLIGASPNYVGYNDPNTFCDFLKQNPRSVILFDEIEKGHFGCHDLLMRILDEGEFINSKGEKVSLKDTIIFCTTNFTQNVKNVAGFGGGITTEQKMTTEGIGLKKELVGRFTDVIEYKQLQSNACKQIVEEKFLKYVISTFEKNNNGKIKLLYDNTLLEKIIDDANTNLFGARDLKKSIQKNFISIVSKYVIENNCNNKTLMITSSGVKEINENKKDEEKEIELSI